MRGRISLMSRKFDELSDFILNKMRMSHVYQPVMLIELLKRKGSASVTDIAKSFLGYDNSQIEYYEHVVKSMVGRVLTKNRGITSKNKDLYSLIGFSELSETEITDLIKQCEKKLDEFLAKRGNRVWQHRKKLSEYVSGTVRYEVLKQAKSRCELCGISAEEKALQVDHILPRNSGGSNDPSNLQALCYSCNAMKGDRDDTDFREMAASYGHRERGCIFCEIPKDRIIDENELAFAILDGFPVTEQHTLMIPKRHISDYFSLTQPERNAVYHLLERQKEKILKSDATVGGFNVGNNVGADAGQTVMHCHTHLIPRRKGDVANPRGGVRGVIPGKQAY